MLPLIKARERAVFLRKAGRTYSEILQEVHVAKSTLSNWLKNVALAKPQKHRITLKKVAAQIKAVKAVKEKRKLIVKHFIDSGAKDIGNITNRDLFILGVALYWAEGAKQKEKFNISQAVVFTNSNASIIKVFLTWLRKHCQINGRRAIKFELYIHEKAGIVGAREAVTWWKTKLQLSENAVIKVRYKKHKLNPRRHIIDYHGQFRVKVSKSTNLNRRIAGWIAAVASKF